MRATPPGHQQETDKTPDTQNGDCAPQPINDGHQRQAVQRQKGVTVAGSLANERLC
jgi:hypothetical protein